MLFNDEFYMVIDENIIEAHIFSDYSPIRLNNKINYFTNSIVLHGIKAKTRSVFQLPTLHLNLISAPLHHY
jgi:hypothetical protein